MPGSRKSLFVPILILALGICWLLNTLKIMPGVEWIWTGGLAIIGILAVVIGGVNKMTFVVGPFLLICSVFSILRQTGRISIDHEIPILVIVLGGLLLIAQLAPLPNPEWMRDEEKK